MSAEKPSFVPQESPLIILSKDRPTTIQEHTDVILSMEDKVIGPLVDRWFPSTAKRWLPQDAFWEAGAEDENEKRRMIREQALLLPDEVLIAVIGNEITEEYLSGFVEELGRLTPMRGRTGIDQRPLSKGRRLWGRDEWSHGTILGMYRREHPKIDVNAVDRDILYYHENGFDSRSGEDPYYGFLYTVGQEYLTEKAHGNVGAAAKQAGDETLSKICRKVKGDEQRHYGYYLGVDKEIFKRDPGGAVITLWNVLRFGIVMPGARMGEMGKEKHKSPIFVIYSEIMESTGILTIAHYLDMYEMMMREFDVEHLAVTGEAAKARDNLLHRYSVLREKADEFMTTARERKPEIPIAWIKGRSVSPSHPSFHLETSSINIL